MEKVTVTTSCRLCGNSKLHQVLDFGQTPPANSFLKKSELRKAEDFFPLKVNFCTRCGQLQLSHVVNPEILFRHYVWVSSTSKVTVAHFEEYARSVFSRFQLKKGDLVVEMGSNDGVLLRPFKALGAKVLGVDPARNVAARATREGIPTLSSFFNVNVAKRIAKKHGKAAVITANNVFAHIHDLDEIMRAVHELLDNEGVFVIEAPYNGDMVEKKLFDIVYHEHLSYLSLRPLARFFRRFGMRIFDVVKTPVHGGSVRLFVCLEGAKFTTKKSVQRFLDLEERMKLHDIDTYRVFAKKIWKNKTDLTTLLTKLKKQKKRIAAYGAPAKSTTLLHYFHLGKETLDFIVDDSPFKVGLFTPGTHIPVVATKQLYVQKPDYVLILAWNFADSIMTIHKKYKDFGGKFIIPVPTPKVI